MKYLLIVFVVIAIVLHVAEHFAKKGKQILSLASILFHILVMFACLFFQFALTDLFAFLLCSVIVDLFLKVKGRKNGI